jgi:hypothetical protein
MACRERVLEVGFWFEPVTFESRRLPGPITQSELDTIRTTATAELQSAFKGLRIKFSDRRDTRFHVRVVQALQDLRSQRPGGGAGQARAISGFGGSGDVSFSFLASGALTFAPPDADRSAIVTAIGRAIGRTAVHELTHQLLPTAPIHDSRDVRSYEYASAARWEHYYGAMQWDLAWPLLQKRLGPSSFAQ